MPSADLLCGSMHIAFTVCEYSLLGNTTDSGQALAWYTYANRQSASCKLETRLCSSAYVSTIGNVRTSVFLL